MREKQNRMKSLSTSSAIHLPEGAGRPDDKNRPSSKPLRFELISAERFFNHFPNENREN